MIGRGQHAGLMLAEDRISVKRHAVSRIALGITHTIAAAFHGSGRRAMTRTNALDLVYSRLPSTRIMLSRPSTGRPYQSSILFPSSDCIVASLKTRRRSNRIRNLAHAPHKRQTPSNSTTRSFGPTFGAQAWVAFMRSPFINAGTRASKSCSYAWVTSKQLLPKKITNNKARVKLARFAGSVDARIQYGKHLG